MKIPKIKTKKIKDSLKKLPRVLGENAFLAFLGLLVIALILGGLIFYKYSFLVEKELKQYWWMPMRNVRMTIYCFL